MRASKTRAMLLLRTARTYMQVQQDLKVPVSPALVLNEGRQLLNGNVGYRVIEANIRELLANSSVEASWL